VIFIDEIIGPTLADVRPVYISSKTDTIFGYSVEDWMEDASLWEKILHPENREEVLARGVTSDRAGVPFSAEYRVVARDGRVVWVQEEAVIIRHEGARYWQGVIFDITARKLAEAELRRSFELLRRTDEERRKLLGQLVSAQEEERKRLATEIHDDPVQKMTAVGLRLEMLRGELSEPDQRETVDRLRAAVHLAIARMRSLLFELRPPSLDRAGLGDALREYVAYTDGELGRFRLNTQLVSEPSVATRTIAYRIAVEALGNVQRHARADHVDVLLTERDGGLFMRIRDDGVGMPEDVVSNGKPGHLGLTSVRERAEMAGGWSRIETSQGAGTTVEVWLPMDLAAGNSSGG
jgi:PAS domain S-box-containing protein